MFKSVGMTAHMTYSLVGPGARKRDLAYNFLKPNSLPKTKIRP